MLGLVVVVAAIGVMAISATAASAAVLSCSPFNGRTTQLTPVPLILDPPAPGGTFTFASSSAPLPTQCTDATHPTPVASSISSTGTYRNLVCGTGFVPATWMADGSITATATVGVGTPPTNHTITYDIAFVAGTGAVRVKTIDNVAATGGGTANIFPSPSGSTGVGGTGIAAPGSGNCVVGFDVIGNVAASA
jgi:hypothetical protein